MPQRAHAALKRQLFIAFLPSVFGILHPGARPLRMDWYLLAMCQAFQRAGIGRSRRLVINVPPRHLKSICATAFTAWMLGRSPGLKIMIATYGDKLGREHLERLQTIMNHPFYRRLFPATRLVPGGVGQGLLRTAANGGCRIVTVNGATTGFGADIIIIDDAMKAEDITSEARREELRRFFQGTLLTRLDNKQRGIIISIQQRLGEDDLPGWLIGAGADHLSLPAYDDQERVYDLGLGRLYRRPPGEVLRPADEPRDVLDQHRREMGPHAFATQYLQQPNALEGNIIRTDRFHRFHLDDMEREDFIKVAQSWDTASSEEPGAAYSVCLTFGYHDFKWYLLDVFRQRLNYPDLRDMVVALRKRWRADAVLIEDASSGAHLWDDLAHRGAFRPTMIKPDGDKVTRMVGQLALIEDGEVLLPYEAPWLDILIAELRAFPASRYKDQADALSQFLGWAKGRDRWARTVINPRTRRRDVIERPDRPRRGYGQLPPLGRARRL